MEGMHDSKLLRQKDRKKKLLRFFEGRLKLRIDRMTPRDEHCETDLAVVQLESRHFEMG